MITTDEPQYVVAPNTTITTLRGTRKPGYSVTARDFVDGQAHLDELIKAGAIKRLPKPATKSGP